MKYHIPLTFLILLMGCSGSTREAKLESISLSMGPSNARHIQWTKTEVRYLDDSKRDADEVEIFYTLVFKFDRDRFERVLNSVLSTELIETGEEGLGGIHGPWVCLELHYESGEVKKWGRSYPTSNDFSLLDSLLNFSGDFLRKESQYFQISTAECGRAPAPSYVQDPSEIKVPTDSTSH